MLFSHFTHLSRPSASPSITSMPGRPPSPASPHSPNLNSPSSSSTTTTSHRSPAATSLSDYSSLMSDEDETVLLPTSASDNPTSTTTPSPPPRTNTELAPLPPPPFPATATRTPSFPVREDCWSEEATHTLIDAWGSHYLELNRGNLRQKHWQEVAEAVNALHAHTKKLRRTDIQCKNRIDTLKKKYKIEKSKFIESNGRYVSPWPFFTSLDSLIGENFLKNAPPSPSPPAPRKHFPAVKNSPSPAPPKKEFLALPPPPSAVPVGPRSKRPAPTYTGTAEDSFRRNFSAMAAAAAAAAEEEEEEDEESDTSTPAVAMIRRKKKKRREEDVVTAQGCRQLAEAIGRFGEIYERVEEEKQKLMVELEKQRMQFAKDLEIQRMKLIMDSQVYLAKLKRPKRSSHTGHKDIKEKSGEVVALGPGEKYVKKIGEISGSKMVTLKRRDCNNLSSVER